MTQWVRPNRIELVGGPFDGDIIDWPGGIFALVCNYMTGERYLYKYVMERAGDVLTIRIAEFAAPDSTGVYLPFRTSR